MLLTPVKQISHFKTQFLESRQYSLGFLAGAAGAALFAMMAVFVRLCREELSLGQIVFARGAGALLVLGLLHAREVRGVFSREALILWIRAFFGSVAVCCYFLNIQDASIGVATVLNNLAPVFVMLISVLYFKKTVRTVGVIGIGLATAGVVLLTFPKSGTFNLQVVVVGFLSALSGALAYLSLKRASGRFSSGVVVFCFSLMLMGFSFLDPQFFNLNLTRVPWFPLLGMIVTALFAQLFLTISFRSQEATTAATLNLTVVIWAVFLDIIVLGTHFSVLSLSGAVAVLVGVYLCHVGDRA